MWSLSPRASHPTSASDVRIEGSGFKSLQSRRSKSSTAGPALRAYLTLRWR